MRCLWIQESHPAQGLSNGALPPAPLVVETVSTSSPYSLAPREHLPCSAIRKRAALLPVHLSRLRTCLLTLILVRLITSPLRQLVQDMWTLSRMNVSQPLAFPRSCLSEVNALMKSFAVLQKSLREYRKFMPETLWVSQQENVVSLADSKDCPEPSAISRGMSMHAGDARNPLWGVPEDPAEGLSLPGWGSRCPLCPAPAVSMPMCTVACFGITSADKLAGASGQVSEL